MMNTKTLSRGTICQGKMSFNQFKRILIIHSIILQTKCHKIRNQGNKKAGKGESQIQKELSDTILIEVK